MDVTELSRDQLVELKGKHLDDRLYETEGRGASYGELADADEIISDEEIFEVYSGYDFSDDDFSCTTNGHVLLSNRIQEAQGRTTEGKSKHSIEEPRTR